MLNILLNFVIIIISWSIYSYIYKDLIKYFNNIEIKTLYFIIYEIILVILFLYVLLFNRDVIKNFSTNIQSISWGLIAVIIISLLDIISSFAYYNLLNHYDITHLIPLLRGFSTILIACIGYVLFKEILSKKSIIGIITIIIGIYVINMDK